MRQPVIFAGMHRSGTSLLGRLLESLGLFTGTRKDENNESLFFQQLNEWLMAQCGARWDMPQALRYIWKDRELLDLTETYVRYLLASPRAIHFTGLRRYLFAGGILQARYHWGWKDPRNTFTLPFWLRIYPGARIIYIERHGVDVAQSLRERGRRGLRNANEKYRKYRFIMPLRPKGGGFVESPRCTTLQGGFSLWKEYMDQAKTVMEQLPGQQILKLHYEKLLEDPIPCLRSCAEFCSLDASSQQLETLTAGINTGRAFSYLNDPELVAFAGKHQADLAEYGYN